MNAFRGPDYFEALLDRMETSPWFGELTRRIDADAVPVRQCLSDLQGRVVLHLAPDTDHDFADMLAQMNNHRAELVQLARIGLAAERAAARFGEECLACGSWNTSSKPVRRRRDLAIRAVTCHACAATYHEIWDEEAEFRALLEDDSA